MKTILVSSCLLGLNARYNGTTAANKKVLEFLARNRLIPIPVCPEQLGGLPTPRPECWFSCGDGNDVLAGAGRVQTKDDQDITASFLAGASECTKIARLTDAKMAILKQRSPSCGSQQIYRKQELVNGQGVAAAMLQKAQVTVFSEDNLPVKKP